jgi:hypothetical protein
MVAYFEEVISQKSAEIVNIAAEARNHEVFCFSGYYNSILCFRRFRICAKRLPKSLSPFVHVKQMETPGRVLCYDV